MTFLLTIYLFSFCFWHFEGAALDRLLLKKIVANTDESFIVDGDCDYIIKEETGAKNRTTKIGVTKFCYFDEEEIFAYEINRYIVITPLTKRKRKSYFLVKWVQVKGIQNDLVLKQKKFSIAH